MQPIIWIGLVGVAAVAMGSGFLFQGQEIMINLQKLGVGEADIESPISDAFVDLSVTHIDGVGRIQQSIFKNIVNKCSFHYNEETDFDGLGGGKNTKVECKLTDHDGDVIAEGTIAGGPNGLASSVTHQIPITTFIGGRTFVLVEDVRDVTLVALGSFSPPEALNGPG